STGRVQSTTDIVDIAVVGPSDFGDGYSTIEPVHGGTLTSLDFTPVSDTLFSDFSFRGQVVDASDPINVTVTDENGTTFSFSFTVPKANEDFGRLGIESLDGETIKSVLVTDTGGFEEFKQIDFSLVTAPVVPEPATWALMLVGVGAMGGVLRRRAKANFTAA
ncbi:MAG TPA: PEPxxWA-CTERM sorting domain-containing protein, partial [Caulobacteraceae bacterium]